MGARHMGPECVCVGWGGGRRTCGPVPLVPPALHSPFTLSVLARRDVANKGIIACATFDKN